MSDFTAVAKSLFIDILTSILEWYRMIQCSRFIVDIQSDKVVFRCTTITDSESINEMKRMKVDSNKIIRNMILVIKVHLSCIIQKSRRNVTDGSHYCSTSNSYRQIEKLAEHVLVTRKNNEILLLPSYVIQNTFAD